MALLPPPTFAPCDAAGGAPGGAGSKSEGAARSAELADTSGRPRSSGGGTAAKAAAAAAAAAAAMVMMTDAGAASSAQDNAGQGETDTPPHVRAPAAPAPTLSALLPPPAAPPAAPPPRALPSTHALHKTGAPLCAVALTAAVAPARGEAAPPLPRRRTLDMVHLTKGGDPIAVVAPLLRAWDRAPLLLTPGADACGTNASRFRGFVKQIASRGKAAIAPDCDADAGADAAAASAAVAPGQRLYLLPPGPYAEELLRSVGGVPPAGLRADGWMLGLVLAPEPKDAAAAPVAPAARSAPFVLPVVAAPGFDEEDAVEATAAAAPPPASALRPPSSHAAPPLTLSPAAAAAAAATAKVAAASRVAELHVSYETTLLTWLRDAGGRWAHIADEVLPAAPPPRALRQLDAELSPAQLLAAFLVARPTRFALDGRGLHVCLSQEGPPGVWAAQDKREPRDALAAARAEMTEAAAAAAAAPAGWAPMQMTLLPRARDAVQPQPQQRAPRLPPPVAPAPAMRPHAPLEPPGFRGAAHDGGHTRGHTRSRTRSRTRSPSRGRSHGRSRGRSRSRERSRTPTRTRTRSRSRSPDDAKRRRTDPRDIRAAGDSRARDAAAPSPQVWWCVSCDARNAEHPSNNWMSSTCSRCPWLRHPVLAQARPHVPSAPREALVSRLRVRLENAPQRMMTLNDLAVAAADDVPRCIADAYGTLLLFLDAHRSLFTIWRPIRNAKLCVRWN
jgi:hypothetical protein